jgi:hypothetical protein
LAMTTLGGRAAPTQSGVVGGCNRLQTQPSDLVRRPEGILMLDPDHRGSAPTAAVWDAAVRHVIDGPPDWLAPTVAPWTPDHNPDR